MRRELLQQVGDQTFLELITSRLGRQLTNTCLLCDSWIASTTKIAFHLTKKHRAEWDPYTASKGNNISKMYALTRLSPCPACEVKVESAPRHIFFFLHPQAPISRAHSFLLPTPMSLAHPPGTLKDSSRPAVLSHPPNFTSPTPLESLTQVTLLPSVPSQKTKSAGNSASRPKQSQLQRWFQKGTASQTTQSNEEATPSASSSLEAPRSPPAPIVSSLPQLVNPHNLWYAISVLQMISALRDDASVDWSNLQHLQRELCDSGARIAAALSS